MVYLLIVLPLLFIFPRMTESNDNALEGSKTEDNSMDKMFPDRYVSLLCLLGKWIWRTFALVKGEKVKIEKNGGKKRLLTVNKNIFGTVTK